MEELYTTGEWCGIKQYRCCFCPFDILDDGTHDPEAEMYQHWLHRHGSQPEPTPPGGTVLVANKSGREVKQPESVPVVMPELPKRNKRRATVDITESEELTYGDLDTDRAEPDRKVSGDAADGQLG